jgi:glutathione peroxidase
MKSTAFFLVLALISLPSFASGLFDLKVNRITGESESLSKYKGKVLLIVNTASRCGFTSQYAGLQALYDKYKDRGFFVLGFPSNDFGAQEPGTAKEIKNFCETRFKVNFPLFEKGVVSGSHKQPLYAWLVSNEPGARKDSTSEVSWNFEKFLVGKDGKVLARFRSSKSPENDDVVRAVESALK